jgi:nucleoside 2-deoxyribosyltransferase
MIYLASPYSHPDPLIQELRFLRVCAKAADLIAQGVNIYSPIAHWHTVARLASAPISHKRFIEIDFDILNRCDGMIVFCLDGWEESKGCLAEIQYAIASAIPIEYMEDLQ